MNGFGDMASMQSKSAVFSGLAFFVMAFYCLTYANVTVKWEESGNEKTLAPLSSEGTGFVSIKEFFGLLDFTSRWNKTAAKLLTKITCDPNTVNNISRAREDS